MSDGISVLDAQLLVMRKLSVSVHTRKTMIVAIEGELTDYQIDSAIRNAQGNGWIEFYSHHPGTERHGIDMYRISISGLRRLKKANAEV